MNFEEEMEMKHFSHQHPLGLLEKIDNHDKISFGCCGRSYSSSVDDNQVYGCEDCNYFIHQSCSEIPHEIRHFYHPQHALKLETGATAKQWITCATCYKRCGGFTYRCVECPDFHMDIECALLPTKLEYSESLHYQHHGHPLTLFQSSTDTDVNNNEDGGFCCIICDKLCEGTIYKCDRCDIYIHESCTKVEVPQEISHYFHPHSLKPLRNTTTVPDYKFVECKACSTWKCPSFCFQCMDCYNFFMDFGCALLPDKLIQDGSVDHINHFLHGHPLLLLSDSKETTEKLCTGCKEPCLDPTYGCIQCGFFLHQSCARLPQRIDHLFHPDHFLTLMLDDVHEDCYVCCERPLGDCLRYRCELKCGFSLHAKCASVLNPTIEFEAHDHALILHNHKHWRCTLCDVCGHELLKDSLVFRCTTCNYYLHLLCGPLPRTIKDQCHIDPLKLMDAFVEDYDETDEVYCDTCEQMRDPNEPVYYCKECNFITEIKCVMNEVVHSLEGHRGKVKLRTAGKDKVWIGGTACNDLCADNIEENIETDSDTEIKDVWDKYLEVKLAASYDGFNFYTSEESEKLNEIFAGAERLGNSMRIGREIHKVSDGQPYSDETIRNLMEKIDDSFYYMNDFDITGGEIVGISELMIMEELASFLKGLLHAYGDFTANSSLGPRLKMFFLNPLCIGIRSMCTTNVKEVDEIMLGRWWRLLLTVKHAGFEIQFLIDRLSKTTLAFCGRQVKATNAKTKCQVDETYDAVKELEAKLDAKKRGLEVLKLSLVSQKKIIEYERTPTMKACLEYDSELKWKKVYEGSPLMFRKFPKPSHSSYYESGGGGEEEEDVGCLERPLKSIAENC